MTVLGRAGSPINRSGVVLGMPDDKPVEPLETTAEKVKAAAESEDPRSALQAAFRPLYEAHLGHRHLVEGCVYCEGIIT